MKLRAFAILVVILVFGVLPAAPLVCMSVNGDKIEVSVNGDK